MQLLLKVSGKESVKSLFGFGRLVRHQLFYVILKVDSELAIKVAAEVIMGTVWQVAVNASLYDVEELFNFYFFRKYRLLNGYRICFLFIVCHFVHRYLF